MLKFIGYSRVSLVSFLAILGLCFATSVTVGQSSAWAAKPVAYDGDAFAKAQAAGEHIVLDLHSNRCATCVKQQAVMEKLLDDAQFKPYHWFQVNYEGAGAMKDKYQVDHSSLILFHGQKEVGRGVGHMDEKSIYALLYEGLGKSKGKEEAKTK